MNTSLRWWLWSFVVVAYTAVSASAQTIARCGEGWLEKIDGALVLHLKGTPYEMGYQHGALLRMQVRSNLHNLIEVKAKELTLVEMGPLKVTPRAAIETIQRIVEPHVDRRYFEEMDGLARGSQTEVADVRVANFIPELFHCSGFAVSGSATENGEMLHGRVLDYAVDWGLQDHAVLIVAEPKGRLPWVNVSYAGFIGSVTGMNAEHVSVGEMGGGGVGHWEGRPMSLLVRETLETAKSLDEAIASFRDGPRTCQYFYVIADGETDKAVGMEASWDVFSIVEPGKAHPLLPNAVPDCVLLSAGDRYTELVKRTQERHGKLTPERALELMARPVAMKSNLHNVLFAPKSLDLWVAHASSDRRPAAEQRYQKFSLKDLLQRKPATDSPAIPMEQAVTAN